jgi:hypothetical protein
MTARIGQLEQDRQNMISRDWTDRTIQAEQERQKLTGRTGHAALDRQNWTNRNRAARAGNQG